MARSHTILASTCTTFYFDSLNRPLTTIRDPTIRRAVSDSVRIINLFHVRNYHSSIDTPWLELRSKVRACKHYKARSALWSIYIGVVLTEDESTLLNFGTFMLSVIRKMTTINIATGCTKLPNMRRKKRFESSVFVNVPG